MKLEVFSKRLSSSSILYFKYFLSVLKINLDGYLNSLLKFIPSASLRNKAS